MIELPARTYTLSLAGTRGGGVYCESALLTIESSTFTGNEAVHGGGFGNGVDGAPGCITQLDSVTVTANLRRGPRDRDRRHPRDLRQRRVGRRLHAVAGVQLLPEPGGASGLAAGAACLVVLGARRPRSRTPAGPA